MPLFEFCIASTTMCVIPVGLFQKLGVNSNTESYF